MKAVAERIAADAVRRSSAFDAARFEAFVDGPARRLARSLGDGSDEVVESFLRLGAEALGLGLLRGEPGSWLEHALTESVPRRLVDVAPDARLAALAEVWNLGEGLMSEPAWLDRFVLAQVDGPQHPGRVRAWLAQALGPALVAPAPSRWAAPFRLHRVDARRLDGAFLPGTLHLAGPCVVAVGDLRRPTSLVLLLRPGGASTLIGPVPPLPSWEASPPRPDVRPAERAVRVGEIDVPLPEVPEARAVLAAPGGFVVVAASDSQRLWVLEAS
jgi:hypothetical protein